MSDKLEATFHRADWMESPHEYDKQDGYTVCECGRPAEHEIHSSD